MRDGRTRRTEGEGAGLDPDQAAERFLEEHRAALVVLRGAAMGEEHELSSRRLLIGRGTNAGLRLDDDSVSHEHALVELGPEGFAVRDLGSTNGVRLNGLPVTGAELAHGDRLAIGGVELQLVVEPKPGGTGRVWQLPEADDPA